MKNKWRNVKELQSIEAITRNRWLLCCLLAILQSVMFCLAGENGFAQTGTLDRIVAVVNNEIILYSELEEQVSLLQKVAPGLNLNNSQEREQFERETLQRMVKERLVEQEVKRLNINVDKRDIDNAVENFKKENGFTDDQLKYVLQQQGKTLEEFRENIKKQLERARLIERVLKSKTVVTDEQIDAYLQGNPNPGVTGLGRERRHLAVIFLPFRDKSQVNDVEKLAQDIHGRLKKGEDFARLAGQYSQGPAAQEGGDLGFIAADELSPAIESATRGLNANQFSEPMKTPQGYYIIKVLEVQRETQAAGSAGSTAARDKARSALFQQEVDRRYEQWIKELTDKSFIQINL